MQLNKNISINSSNYILPSGYSTFVITCNVDTTIYPPSYKEKINGSESVKVKKGSKLKLAKNSSYDWKLVYEDNDGSDGTTSVNNSNLSLGTIDEDSIDILIDTGTDVTLPAATDTTAGLMTAADKALLDSLTAPTAGGAYIDMGERFAGDAFINGGSRF
jgi:hypothetical protein